MINNINISNTLLEIFLEDCRINKSKVCLEIENYCGVQFSKSYNNIDYKFITKDDYIEFVLINNEIDQYIFTIKDLNKYNIIEYDEYINISNNIISINICII